MVASTYEKALCIGAKVNLSFDMENCQGYNLFAYLDENQHASLVTSRDFQYLENSYQNRECKKHTLDRGSGHYSKSNLTMKYKPYYCDPGIIQANLIENERLYSSIAFPFVDSTDITRNASPTRHYLNVVLMPTHKGASIAFNDGNNCGVWGQMYITAKWLFWNDDTPMGNRLSDDIVITATDVFAGAGTGYQTDIQEAYVLAPDDDDA